MTTRGAICLMTRAIPLKMEFNPLLPPGPLEYVILQCCYVSLLGLAKLLVRALIVLLWLVQMVLLMLHQIADAFLFVLEWWEEEGLWQFV